MWRTSKKHSRQDKRVPQRLHLDDRGLWRRVSAVPAIIAFLDFDGVLVEIAPTPADVQLAKSCKRWLKDVVSLPDCSVAVVSGRPIYQLRHLIGLDNVFYVGCHGLEWAAPDGNLYVSWLNEAMVDALVSLSTAVRERIEGLDGVFVENKGLCLALHYRMAERDTAWAARKEFVRAVSWYQQQGVKLDLLSGKEVIEARPAGMTKGDAIRQIWTRYAPGALPVYVGDDAPDESAFDAIAAKGLPILVSETPSPSAAQRFLKDPSEVYVFLRCLTHIREKGAWY